MTASFKTADLSRVKKISLSRRKSLASINRLAVVPSRAGAKSFFDALPGFLKADDFRALITKILAARRKNKPVIVMIGGHVIKVGLSPLLIDLMKTGLVTGLCGNGAVVIHDAEMAMVGRTSEDVAEGLVDGSFGMSAETADLFARATALADETGCGLGEAAGTVLNNTTHPYRKHSLLAACRRLGLPAMIHIAVDTDIVCQHPEYDAAAAARASHHDFKVLVEQIAGGENGGVFINIGSAVILPEVFLKALTVARNLYRRPYKFVTANFDMFTQYRPLTNVVTRPTGAGGVGYNFVGHHELMIPLLAWGLKAMMTEPKKKENKKSKKRG